MKSTKFKHGRFDCEVSLTGMGHYCGYVGLPEGHPWFGVFYDFIIEVGPAEVHGGLTYSEFRKDGLWWIGFDCAHSGDGMKEGLPGWKDEAYATAETKKLAEQCATSERYEYKEAIRALNAAAYAALRAARDTEALPMVNRQRLREIAALTDKQVDEGVGE